MSSSAFINFLASLRQPTEAPRGEPNAKLIGVPLNVRDEVITERRPVRIQGEVVQARADGTVRIRTDRGDVEFRPADGQRVPAEGQKIEIEIPPNRNTKQAPDVLVYRRLPPSPEQTQATTPNDTRTTRTPVDVRIEGQTPQTKPLTPQPSTPTTPQPFPPEGTAVRLQPLPPQIQNALTPYTPQEEIIAILTPVSDVRLQTIVQKAQSDLDTALQILKAPPALATTSPLTSLAPSPSLDFLGEEGYKGLAQSAYPQRDKGETSLSTLSTFTAPQKTILHNFAEFLPRLPAQLIQKIAFGSLKPALQTPAISTQTPAPPDQKLQTLEAALTETRISAVEITPQTQQPGEKFIKPETLFSTPKIENSILHNQKAGTIVGVVTNFTQKKLPIVSVFFPQNGITQQFTLQFPSMQIPIGTQIQITPQTPAIPQNPAQIAPALLPLPLQLAPGPWPLIDDIHQTLTQTHPPVAQAFANMTPSPANPVQMSPAMLFFVAAVRGGDLTQWLSDKTIDALKSTGKSSLLSRLTQEGSNLARLASEPLSQDWRALNLPMLYQGDMQKIALYYRNEYNENANDEDGKTLKGTRFVFDLNLDAMGKVQLDGLFRPISDAGKRLDLVVRTEQFFSQANQGEMRRIYARALRDTGVTGELSFQNKPESWVTVSGTEKSSLSVNS